MKNNYLQIPKEIKELNQWVGASNEHKIPIVATSNYPASASDSSTWCSFEEAANSPYEHIGFVFNDNGIVGIDIDVGFEDGFVSRIASDIISHCHSYTELSKSGRGFHILVKGDLPFNGRNNHNGVEIYKSSRYFIMTGNCLYQELVENQEAIDYIVNKYFKDEERESNSEEKDYKIYSPIWQKPNKTVKLTPTYPLVNKGSRNVSMLSLAGQLHRVGYSPKQIFKELSKANKEACKPPLKDNELMTIIKSVSKYKRN